MTVTPKTIVDPMIGGIDTKDYPDFSDAYLEDGYVKDNGDIRPMTDDELNEFNENYGEWIHQKIFDDQLYM